MNWEDIVSIVIASVSGVMFVILLIVYLSSRMWRKTHYLKTAKTILMDRDQSPMVEAIVGTPKYNQMLQEVKRIYPRMSTREAISRHHKNFRPNTLMLHSSVQDQSSYGF